MSLVRVAVPVLQGRCRFFFEKGRPWSVIEHVLLEATARKSYTMSDLAVAGRLPHRLVIEAIIRLMRAGWVEMVERGSSIRFRATTSGVVAATHDDLPNAPRQLNRSINFVVDQITGTVYRRRELPSLLPHMVEEMAKREQIVRIDRPDIVRLDEVGPLLEALFSDDERFISMESDGGRLLERWSLVSVGDGKVQGLTSRAPEKLVKCVEQAARTASPEEPPIGLKPYHVPREYIRTSAPTLPIRRVNLVQRDIILGGREHKDVLYGALLRSRRRVIVHSTFISWDRFSDLLPAISEAVGRGVRVDVLWGQEESFGDNTTREVVRRIKTEVSGEQLDLLNVHAFSTGSHSKILLADEGDPYRMFAFVGSCNWLSSPFQSFEASVRLRDPLVVADVVDQVAELSKGGRGHWSPLTKELAAMSAALRAVASEATRGRTCAQVILGSSHADLVRRARDESQDRIFVASHRWGTGAKSIVLAPVLAAARDRKVRVDAYYGTMSGPPGLSSPEEYASEVQTVQVSAVRNPRLHAKLLAWDDDSVVITSQNWLSSDPPDSLPRQEIGVFLDGPGLAKTVVERFEHARRSGSANLASSMTDRES